MQEKHHVMKWERVQWTYRFELNNISTEKEEIDLEVVI